MHFLPLLVLLLFSPAVLAAPAAVEHALEVKLIPASGRIVVTDVITLPNAPTPSPVEFELQAGLKIVAAEPAVAAVATGSAANGRIRYAWRPAAGQRRLTLRYEGSIELPPQQIHSGFGRNQEASGGVIAADGVYLDSMSAWYPLFDDALLRFSLEVELPPGWNAVSQGTRHRRDADATRASEQWQETRPQEEIYLVAAPFHEYREAGAVEKLVMLRTADPALAQKYLGVIDEYIDLYTRLLGPYPYGKFALVENSWESGYGMPSFTLLGPRVIRLPFILRGSFPHEILHNWWGNGVYVDGAGGNWSEGLTAYLADHLLQEQRGGGAAYRRDALLRYTNYVAEQADFPLAQFRVRHSDASQAVGYDKALMFFHALRLEMGDERFLAALRRFYRDQLFHLAGWDDLRRAFEAETKSSLKAEFEQWLQRSGAPALRVADAHAERRGDGYALTLTLQQTQAGPAYRVQVPVAITVDGESTTVDRVVAMQDKKLEVTLPLTARPWRITVDPDFDVFRRLDAAELPPTLSEALAAEHVLIVLPAAAPPAQREGYAALARGWAESAAGVRVSWDNELQALPEGQAVWLLGWQNRFRAQFLKTLAGQPAAVDDEGARIAEAVYSRAEHAVVMAGRGSDGRALVWLGADNPKALTGLARKLPHYGSASYLAFRGDEPVNVLKGQWQVLNSPLAVAVRQPDGAAVPAPTAVHRPRPALAQASAGNQSEADIKNMQPARSR